MNNRQFKKVLLICMKDYTTSKYHFMCNCIKTARDKELITGWELRGSLKRIAKLIDHHTTLTSHLRDVGTIPPNCAFRYDITYPYTLRWYLDLIASL